MKTRLALLGLMLLALLPSACHLTEGGDRAILAIEADASLTGRERVLIVLRDARGNDTLFNGKLSGLDTLSRLPAPGYSGGKALIIIQGFDGGVLVYEERREYDGGTGLADIEIVLDPDRPTNSVGSLDIRPDNVRLFVGGEPAPMSALPAQAWQGKTLAWSTGNPDVAVVSQTGVLTPVGAGVTYVRAASGDTARDAAAVTVVRDAPVLDVGGVDTVLALGAPVIFNVKVTQEYGKVASFAWDLDGDGTFEDSATGSSGQTLFAAGPKTYAAAGELLARFRARDGEGNVTAASKRVKVNTAAPRIGSFSASPMILSIRDSVAFTAQAAGTGADLASASWDFDGDGKEDRAGVLSGASASLKSGYRYPMAGAYRAGLKITDATGAAVSAVVEITVKLDRPTADAGVDQSTLPGAAVRLKGLAADSLGGIVLREWKIGALEFAPAPDSGTVSFAAPAAPGELLCVFRATDDDGLTAEDTLKLTINDSKAPAIAALLPRDTVISIRDSIAFTAKVTSSDADLKSFTVDYVAGDGTVDVQGALSGRTGDIRAGHRYPAAGQFDVILKVEDVSGKSATAQARVTVLQDAPKADAGKDTVVAAGGRANLHGRASDSLGTVSKLEWKIGANPFLTVSKGDTSFTAPATAGTVTCVFRVTDDDSLVSVDSVIVTVSPSALAALSGLALSSGTLAPVFGPADTVYAASVASNVTSIKVTPTAANAATIKVNGNPVASGAASDALSLAVGNTVISVEATAQDGKTKRTYKVTVTRAGGTDATLSNLVLGGTALNPVFAPATMAYTASVANSVTSVTVTPTAAGVGSAIKVNNVAVASGTASGAIPLELNNNTITIVVTAQDGITTKPYTVTVKRELSTNAKLSGLGITAGASLSPAFNADTLNYTVSYSSAATSFKITPTAAVAGGNLIVDGFGVASGTASEALAFLYGATKHTIVVTAPDHFTTRTYNVTVFRDAPPDVVTGYASISDPMTSATLEPGSDWWYNPAGDITFTRSAAGKYRVVLKGLAAAGGADGIVHVTALTADPGYCKITDWTGAEDVSAGVACYTPNGTAEDFPFTIMALFPRGGNSGDNGYVFADQPSVTTAYAPNPARSWNNRSLDGNVVSRTGAGAYQVTFKGQGNTAATDRGNLMVTAVGANSVRCAVDATSLSGADILGNVVCKNAAGTPTDAQFNLSLMKAHKGTAFGIATAYVSGATEDARGYYSTNNADKSISITNDDIGSYVLWINGVGGLGVPRTSTIQVTPFGAAQNAICTTDQWANLPDIYTAVHCFDPRGTPVNASFNLWIIR
jgi:cadherin-like protein